MKSYNCEVEIIRKEQISAGIYRIILDAPQVASTSIPGQFLMVRTTSSYDPLLRRPFSIHLANPESGLVQILFKVLGKGTRFLADASIGDSLDIVGPLGKGFDSSNSKTNICLVGGGMGIAPLYFLAKTLLSQKNKSESYKFIALLGASTEKEIVPLVNDFRDLGISIMYATDDGSSGHHGLVTELMDENMSSRENWRIFSCGPYPMMRTVALKAKKQLWGCQVSLETMMACGISACLGCAVPKPVSENGESAGYYHVCKDGPVFDAGDIKWA